MDNVWCVFENKELYVIFDTEAKAIAYCDALNRFYKDETRFTYVKWEVI